MGPADFSYVIDWLMIVNWLIFFYKILCAIKFFMFDKKNGYTNNDILCSGGLILSQLLVIVFLYHYYPLFIGITQPLSECASVYLGSSMMYSYYASDIVRTIPNAVMTVYATINTLMPTTPKEFGGLYKSSAEIVSHTYKVVCQFIHGDTINGSFRQEQRR